MHICGSGCIIYMSHTWYYVYTYTRKCVCICGYTCACTCVRMYMYMCVLSHAYWQWNCNLIICLMSLLDTHLLTQNCIPMDAIASHKVISNTIGCTAGLDKQVYSVKGDTRCERIKYRTERGLFKGFYMLPLRIYKKTIPESVIATDW